MHVKKIIEELKNTLFGKKLKEIYIELNYDDGMWGYRNENTNVDDLIEVFESALDDLRKFKTYKDLNKKQHPNGREE